MSLSPVIFIFQKHCHHKDQAWRPPEQQRNSNIFPSLTETEKVPASLSHRPGINSKEIM